jgi:hypothetical protein
MAAINRLRDTKLLGRAGIWFVRGACRDCRPREYGSPDRSRGIVAVRYLADRGYWLLSRSRAASASPKLSFDILAAGRDEERVEVWRLKGISRSACWCLLGGCSVTW